MTAAKREALFAVEEVAYRLHLTAKSERRTDCPSADRIDAWDELQTAYAKLEQTES